MSGLFFHAGGKNPVHDGINSYGAAFLVTAHQPADAVQLRKFAAALMAETASACLMAGAGDISHVKAYIEHASGFLHADTVGDKMDVKVEGRDGEPTETFRLVVNAVIYGLSPEAVKESTEASIERTMRTFGFTCPGNDCITTKEKKNDERDN
ncbi:MAG: hypothetical protein WAV13_13715 [Thermodesulfovibrionales bacterium]